MRHVTIVPKEHSIVFENVDEVNQRRARERIVNRARNVEDVMLLKEIELGGGEWGDSISPSHEETGCSKHTTRNTDTTCTLLCRPGTNVSYTALIVVN